jgi:hypothetical protein
VHKAGVRQSGRVSLAAARARGAGLSSIYLDMSSSDCKKMECISLGDESSPGDCEEDDSTVNLNWVLW